MLQAQAVPLSSRGWGETPAVWVKTPYQDQGSPAAPTSDIYPLPGQLPVVLQSSLASPGGWEESLELTIAGLA